MVPGFNTDFKYRGETYHVQTEDNGLSNPVVVTLLYHKGAILASKRTSYKEIAGQSGYEKELKVLMQNQHKDLMRSLLAGEFDKDGTAPAVAGGTGENPADAAAAIAATAPPVKPAPPVPPPAAQALFAGQHKPLRSAPAQHAPPVQAPAPVSPPLQAKAPPHPKPPEPHAPAPPRPELHVPAATPAHKPAQGPSEMSLDMAIRNYLEEFAAAAAP